jgi:hypothetical protein
MGPIAADLDRRMLTSAALRIGTDTSLISRRLVQPARSMERSQVLIR